MFLVFFLWNAICLAYPINLEVRICWKLDWFVQKREGTARIFQVLLPCDGHCWHATAPMTTLYCMHGDDHDVWVPISLELSSGRWKPGPAVILIRLPLGYHFLLIFCLVVHLMIFSQTNTTKLATISSAFCKKTCCLLCITYVKTISWCKWSKYV